MDTCNDVCYTNVGKGGDPLASEAKLKANAKYQLSLDRIVIQPKKSEGQQIRQAAADAGQSVQQYILDTLRKRREEEA